jgi:primosomal protein N' (replication factor Y)
VRERQSRVILLHGVTGSGKGEVYLHALAQTLRLGRRAIVLVPEIALTPQTIRRFASRFGGRVAVLHSRLSHGEHFDEWRRIRDGEAEIVIGSRSAILAPIDRLGLVVVDEEHEWSYKQTEKDPRYHAREAAIALGEIAGAPVVLGSATPDVVTYYRASKLKDFDLLELPERVEGGRRPAAVAEAESGPAQGAGAPPPTIPMPTVHVVDLRAEEKADNRSLFSRSLRRAIARALDEGSQSILYLNRRGTATFIVCRVCGYVSRCRRCDLPLVYHADRNQLLCHHCSRPAPVPHMCPACWSRQIGFFGTGTERVEGEVRRLFPEARVVRWDRDTARGKASHTRIMDTFLRGEADILVGTQMIAKGLDLPQVALVGVVVADTALQLPDFRAAERTFQLLMQVAGRAGRGARPGRVLIQTYNPDHYGIQAARDHAYLAFFNQEIQFRAEHRYPPFSDLARLVYYNTSEARCRRETERLATYLEGEIERRGLPDLEVVGPAPAFHRRLRGRFRWQLLLRGGDPRSLLRGLPLPPGWSLDIDPISLL